MINERLNPKDGQSAFGKSPGGILIPAHAEGNWEITARDNHGEVIGIATIKNLVTTVGKNYLLEGIAATNSPATMYTDWYIFLTGPTPSPAAADTMASHAGWVEFVDYTEAARQLYQSATPSAGSITNSANKATFTISGNNKQIGGAGLVNSNDFTESPQTGLLYAVGAFTEGNFTLNDASTLTVTATFSL